jgi:hypothetical protein
MKTLFAFATALLVPVSAAPAAEIKVLSGNGAKAAVRELCTLFERATLIHFLTAPAAAPTHRAKGFDPI